MLFLQYNTIIKSASFELDTTGIGSFFILSGCSNHKYILELETKAIRMFAKVSIVSYSRPSLMIIVSASQFHVSLPWGQRPFSIVS